MEPSKRARIIARDGGCCRWCGTDDALMLHVHHIVPRGDGGTHSDVNVITLCGSHHAAVHANPAELRPLCFQYTVTLLATGKQLWLHGTPAGGQKWRVCTDPEEVYL